jgi:hypothetical protein
MTGNRAFVSKSMVRLNRGYPAEVEVIACDSEWKGLDKQMPLAYHWIPVFEEG